MVSALHGLRIERSGFESRPEHCVVFLGEVLYSHSASLHPGVKIGTSALNAGSNPAMD